jgi:hypothetical protein
MLIRQASTEMHVHHIKNLSWQKAYLEQADHPALNLRHSFLALGFYKKENSKLDPCTRLPTSSAIDAIKNSTCPTEIFVSTRIFVLFSVTTIYKTF